MGDSHDLRYGHPRGGGHDGQSFAEKKNAKHRQTPPRSSWAIDYSYSCESRGVALRLASVVNLQRSK